MLESIGLILVGVLISGVGYLIKRIIEKRSVSEDLDKHKKLLEINKQIDRKSTRLNSSHSDRSRMPSSA